MNGIAVKGNSGSGGDYKSPSNSIFGENLSVGLTNLFQATATYNLLSDVKFETFTATGGAVSAVSREFKASSGTSVGGYGVIRGNRPLVYRAGQGIRAKFTARFPVAGVANSIQFAGLFNVTDTLAIGYDGATFSILHNYGGASDIRTLTISSNRS